MQKYLQSSLNQRGLHHRFPAASHRNPGHYLLGLLHRRWPCKIWQVSLESHRAVTVPPGRQFTKKKKKTQKNHH